MRLYAVSSGALFGLIAAAQASRTLTASPAQVGNFDIPVWWSAVASLVTAGLAVWAFRVARNAA